MTEDSYHDAEDRYYETEDGIVDRHTGEVIEPKEIIEAEYKAVKNRIAELHKEASILGVPVPYKLIKIRNFEHKVVQIKANYLFNKMFRTHTRLLYNDSNLDVYCLAFIARFTPFIVFPENYIAIDNQCPTVEELSRLLKISDRKMRYVLNDLEHHEVIKRVKNGKNNIIYFNPFLFCSGWGTDIETYNLFAGSSFNPRNSL